MLYSVYSFPNVVLPLICGVLIDRVGLRPSICGLTLCVILGAALVWLGAIYKSWTSMLLGRVVFGIGGESIQVAQNTLIFRYFRGGEVALALGLNLSVARMGSSLNAYMSPYISNSFDQGSSSYGHLI